MNSSVGITHQQGRKRTSVFENKSSDIRVCQNLLLSSREIVIETDRCTAVRFPQMIMMWPRTWVKDDKLCLITIWTHWVQSNLLEQISFEATHLAVPFAVKCYWGYLVKMLPGLRAQKPVWKASYIFIYLVSQSVS
jgi:hypothetical protein